MANTAEEIANAKETTDAIINELADAREVLLTAIREREDGFVAIDEQIATLRYEFDQESDDKKKAAKEAEWEAAVNNREA